MARDSMDDERAVDDGLGGGEDAVYGEPPAHSDGPAMLDGRPGRRLGGHDYLPRLERGDAVRAGSSTQGAQPTLASEEVVAERRSREQDPRDTWASLPPPPAHPPRSTGDGVKEEPAGDEGLRRRRAGALESSPPVPHSPVAVKDEPAPKLEDEPLREIGVDTPPPEDDRQCRICLAGPEEEAELGRLISPCLCAGSMRYVHVQCIDQWRGRGTNRKSFLECPQCNHQYAIRRTLVSGLATSKPVLLIFTLIMFLSLSVTAGHFLMKYLVASLDKEDEGWHADGGGLFSSADGHIMVYAPTAAMVSDVVFDAVDLFLDLAGRAFDHWPRSSGWQARISGVMLSLVVRFLLGLAIMGSLSFLSLLASLSLFAPLQLAHTLRGTGLLDNFRRRLPKNIGGILVIIAVVVGVVNSAVQVYDTVRAFAQFILRRIETQILEVNPTDRPRAPTWGDTWMAERRWRTLAGWWEVIVRAWEWAKGAFTSWRERVVAAAQARMAGQAVEVEE